MKPARSLSFFCLGFFIVFATFCSQVNDTYAGPVADKMSIEKGKHEQTGKVLEAFNSLKDFTDQMEHSYNVVNAIRDAGGLDQIDPDLKIVLDLWFTKMKDCRTSVGGNANIMDLYGWDGQ